MPTLGLCSESHRRGCDYSHTRLCGNLGYFCHPEARGFCGRRTCAVRRRSFTSFRMTMCSREMSPQLTTFRFQNHSLAGPAIHHNPQGLRELQMAYASLLFRGSLLGEPLPVERSFSGIGIHRKVSDLERRQVLKKVAALRGRDAEVPKASFDNHARARDFVPLDRNAKPGIVRTPAPHPDQQVRTILRAQNGIEMRHGFCDLAAAPALEALQIDDHHVLQILDASVAENLGATADQLRRIDVSDRQFLVIARE